jgi:hypothetical protein
MKLKRSIVIKAAIICVCVASVLGYVSWSQHHQQDEEWRAKMRMMDKNAREMTLEKITKDDPALARKLRQQDKNAADLKQAQDDYDAGHIGIGELHRIQREVRDREP